ncbi:hypothetical protein E3Q03_03393 [Wallemia mellicola]|uniref:Arabinanase/levansucrase/invertase n=1 Tax=Wallemia mellicola TaxID=1708541 RepID=A0AB74K9Z7_9BASI|nr:hypothetical protein E3Q04_03613 [Wallemia mellicola]TIC60152.1 hypothetical protein E3Q03_03393 [Wallemia mellicola]
MDEITINVSEVRQESHYLRTPTMRPLDHNYTTLVTSENFMNDPNGLVYANDVYHLYHQWNDKDNIPGYQNWGHATSEDLVHWQLHPPAITPDSDDGPFIISGSAVIDEHNTSDLFNESTTPSNRCYSRWWIRYYYFIGDFDGKTFTPIDTSIREMVFGYDDYAGVTFNNVPDGRRLWIGWASNWLYTGVVPTEPWRSSLTLVHELSLTRANITDQHQSLTLRHKPVDLSSLISDTVKETNSPMKPDSIDFPTDGAVDMSIDVSFSSDTESSESSKSASRITIESEDGVNSIEFGVQFADHIVYINRANSGWSSPTFGCLDATSSNIPNNNKVKLRAVIDRSQIELFVQDRIHFASMVFFFQEGRVPARLRYENDEGVMIDHLKLDALKSIWEC